MAKSDISFSVAQTINQALGKLINARMQLGSNWGKSYALSRKEGEWDDAYLREMLLGEEAALNKEMNAENFFQLVLLSEIELVIQDLVNQFYLGQEREKEMRLLIDRLKEIETNHKIMDESEEAMTRILSLEALEREKIRALIFLELLQALDEEHDYLDIEEMEVYEDLKDELMDALKDIEIVKEDGNTLNNSDKLKLSHDWAIKKMEFMDQFIQEKEAKIENKHFTRIYHNHTKQPSSLPSSEKEAVNKGFFSRYNQLAQSRAQHSTRHLFHNEEFKDNFSKFVMNFLNHHKITNSEQVDKFTKEQMASVQHSELTKKTADIMRKARAIKMLQGAIQREEQKLNTSKISNPDGTKQMDKVSLRESRKKKMGNSMSWKGAGTLDAEKNLDKIEFGYKAKRP